MFTTFRTSLLEWYNPERRNLPWKQSSSAYHIWLSEIILQQTRVDQGTPYYLKFIDLYPTISDLAAAPEEEVMKSWEGLGYYSRARNLHAAAKQVVVDFNGQFPSNYENILLLKGVGPYTAAAIASFAYNLPYAVLDGNVFRVLSRYFGIDIPVDTTEGKKYFSRLAQDCLDIHQPAKYNQAIMDFGALVCTPANPTCSVYPLSSNCKAFLQNRQRELPIKSKKIVRQDRCFTFFVIHNGHSVFIEKRKDDDIWKSLYQFPCIEADKLDPSLTPSDAGWDIPFESISISPVFKQMLTHRNIFAQFLEVNLRSNGIVPEAFENQYQRIPYSELVHYPFPKIIREYLSDRFNSLH
jgi:A/G-specific adenine glycosylase